MKRPVKSRLKFFSSLILLWFFIHVFYTCYDGLHNDTGKADVAVVLGNTVYADSSLSRWLKGRMDKALELYREGRVPEIMVSGGKGEYGVNEGDGMKRYLLQHQVPPAAIIVDNNGINTWFTVRDFMAIKGSLHFRSAIVVTSYYHITRTKYSFRKLGFYNVKGVASYARFWQDGYGIVREFFAFYKYVLFYH